MREFKFRAWENGKMYYQVRCGGMFDEIPTAPTVWNEEAGNWVNLTGQPYTKIMQYTGLKDKNGKGIYEGDIVSFKDWKPKTVVFSESAYAGFTLGRTDLFLSSFDSMCMEVIGNIYENPELLGDS